jgi:hypothetical protein
VRTLLMTSEEMTYLYETLRWRSTEFKDTDLKRDVRICKKVMSLIEDEMLTDKDAQKEEEEPNDE